MKKLMLTLKKHFSKFMFKLIPTFYFLLLTNMFWNSQSVAAECTKNVWSTDVCSVSDLNSRISATVGSNLTTWSNALASTSVVGVITPAYYSGSEACQFTEPNLLSSNICSSISIFNVTGSSFCMSGRLKSKVDYATGTTPSSMVVGDFNKDHKIDIAVSNSASSTISVFIGNGDGSFQSKVDYTTTAFPSYLITDDFNRDGQLDLVAVTSGTARINFFPGVGDGTFGARIDTTTSSTPVFVTSGDFNRDGSLDVFTTRASGTVNLYTGNGTGNFPGSFVIGTGTNGETRTGDFNRDGSLDVVASMAGALATYSGTGTTAFSAAAYSVTCTGSTTGMSIGDINNDGKTDVIASCGTTFSINLGVGDGTYLAETTIAKENDSAPSLLIVDYNLDGKNDLAYVGKNGNTLGLKPGNGDGTFQTTEIFATGAGPQSVKSADFNNDGKPDFVTANQTGNSISIFIAK